MANEPAAETAEQPAAEVPPVAPWHADIWKNTKQESPDDEADES